MNYGTESRLSALIRVNQEHLLRGGLKGLEKESLRITSDGLIAQTPHPEGLGSALTHPYITTDYSEALIELVTPPFSDPAATLNFLHDLHAFVYRNLAERELLLATSMPGETEGDDSIPIACYGRSNIGQMKRIYRRGLAYRYGRAMQAIAGVHFNYSVNEALWPVLQTLEANRDPLPKFIADRYFGLIRNVHRFGWLVVYLFGCSPVVCRSFFQGRRHLAEGFLEFDDHTLYRPYATSLRMSDIGYKNDSQQQVDICLDSVDDYVACLTRAIETPHPPYQRIGVKVDGEYRQLNANILQIENEYYSAIRPKQITESGEKPTLALKKRGVRYVELRCVDLNCFQSAGVALEEMYFLEIFLLFCLLADSEYLGREEQQAIHRNFMGVACCGRTPGFELIRRGTTVSLTAWAEELFEAMAAVAEVLDGTDAAKPFTRSLEAQRPLLADASQTPSARLVSEMRLSGETFAGYALRLSREHARTFRALELPVERLTLFRQQAVESLAAQSRIEARDSLSLDEFLRRYFAQKL